MIGSRSSFGSHSLLGTSPTSLQSGILEAAEELFGIRGFNSTTVEAIARLAGTHKMAVYRVFGSKERLGIAYVELLTQRAERAWVELESRFPNTPRRVINEFFGNVKTSTACNAYRGDPCMRLAAEVGSLSEELFGFTARYRIDQWFRFEKIAAYAVPENSPHFTELLYLVWLGFVSPGLGVSERQTLSQCLLEIVEDVLSDS